MRQSAGLVWLLIGLTTARADTYPRQPAVDALHYVFRLTLNDATGEIAGEATVDLLFVNARVTRFALDLTSVKSGKGMTVAAVTSAGKPASAASSPFATEAFPRPACASDLTNTASELSSASTGRIWRDSGFR